MEYRQKDFEKLFLNVYEVPESQDLFKVFPILDTYEIFHTKILTPILDEKKKIVQVDAPMLTNQKVIRYIVYTFDQNTPLMAVPDLVERRVDAAFLAGFRHESNNQFHDAIEKMIKSENFIINQMVVQYCIMQGSDDYLTMVAYQDTLRRSSLNLLNNDYEEKTGALITTMENCRKNIAAIREKLLTTSKDNLLNKSLYIFKEATKLRLRPEDIAKQLMEHDPFFKQLRIS